MASGAIDESQRRAAKVAGLTYLLTTAIVAFAYLGIFKRLFVPGNVAETARNILAHELLFRISIVGDLAYSTGTLVLLAALYVILKSVNQNLALIAAFCRLVYAFTWIVIALDLLTGLRLLSGVGYLRVFEADRLQALARLYLGMPASGVSLPFWGLASAVCSYLWFKSKYIPRAMAAYGVITSAWCVACAFALIISPAFAKVVNLWLFDTPMATFEIALGFWLLFKGLTPSHMAEGDKASHGAQAGAG